MSIGDKMLIGYDEAIDKADKLLQKNWFQGWEWSTLNCNSIHNFAEDKKEVWLGYACLIVSQEIKFREQGMTMNNYKTLIVRPIITKENP